MYLHLQYMNNFFFTNIWIDIDLINIFHFYSKYYSPLSANMKKQKYANYTIVNRS